MSSLHYSQETQLATANANSDASQYRQIQQRPSSLSLPSLGYHSVGIASDGDTFDGNHRGGYATAPSTPSVASSRCFHYSLDGGEDQQSAPPGRPSSGGPTSSTASTTSTALPPKEKEKARRTKSGCLTCRRRRVKCDEAHPICNRCTIAKQDCVYPDPSLALSKAAQRAAARNGSVAPTVMSAVSSAPSSGNGSAKRVRKGGTGVTTDRPSTSAKLSDPKGHEHEHDPSARSGSRSHSPITIIPVPMQAPNEYRGSLSLPSMSAFFQPVEHPTPFGSAPLAPFTHPLRPSSNASLQNGQHSGISVPASHLPDGGAVPLHFDSLFHTEDATAYRTSIANERDSIEELRKRFQGGEGDDDDAGTSFGPAESGPPGAVTSLDALWSDPEYLSRMLESLRGTSLGRDDAFMNMLGDQQDRLGAQSHLQLAQAREFSDAAGVPSGADARLSDPTAAFVSAPARPETELDDKNKAATSTNATDLANRRYLPAYDFSPQPAIDPILAASSSLELHRQAANRDKAVPSLQELGLGPPPVLAGATFTGQLKDWTVPANMEEAMKGMPDQRHAELLRHYFVNIVGLFNPIDHAKNPFRTFVAEHVADSLCLLHAVLALSAINQQPHSVEARAESMLYFEASVDLYVRSLQQQDDIGLFTLLLLSLYSVFDAGTMQPQHFSQRAQGIINVRLDLLSAPEASQRTGASADFRFLVRLHVVYEVLANLSRRPGDLRSVTSGKYTLSTLLQIIEQWDQEEERRAGLSGFNYEDYAMTGLLGIPTFFVSLLNEITQLKEEQHALRLQEAAASLPVEGEGQVQKFAEGAKDEESEQITATLLLPPSHTEIRAAQAKLTQKIRDLESKIQFARPGRLLLPPSVAREAQVHRAVSVRFFDLFRLGTSIHLLLELHEVAPNDPAIQARVSEMVNLLGNIEQNSNYNTSAIFAFFIAGAVATSQNDRSVLYRRLDSTWNSPAGNIWSLRSIMDEVWQRNSECLEAGEPCHSWKDVAQARKWTLLIM